MLRVSRIVLKTHESKMPRKFLALNYALANDLFRPNSISCLLPGQLLILDLGSLLRKNHRHTLFFLLASPDTRAVLKNVKIAFDCEDLLHLY